MNPVSPVSCKRQIAPGRRIPGSLTGLRAAAAPIRPRVDPARGCRRELSQEELSLRSGVHRNYIGGVERAERQPSALTVVRLADALGVKPSEVFKRAERRRG